MYPYNEHDHMEIGDTGLIPAKDGGFYEKDTGNYITAEGLIYDPEGNLIYDPFEDERD